MKDIILQTKNCAKDSGGGLTLPTEDAMIACRVSDVMQRATRLTEVHVRSVLILLLVLGSGACRKKADVPEPTPVPAPAPAPPPKVEEPPPKESHSFRRISFAFDSTSMVGESSSALQANAKILQDYPGVRVEVQGHADERGTTDYNLALGQRRADAVHGYLVGQAVPRTVLRTVSYGEERPADPSSGERAWARNRRVEILVED